MLGRQHRFHGHSSLAYVYRHGSTVRSPYLAVKYARNDRRTDYRVAVIVSRKVHKSAVQRNRIRRRIYEVIRTGELIPSPFDIVVTVFSDQVAGLAPEELIHLVRNLFSKAGLYDQTGVDRNRSGHAIVEIREDRQAH